MLFMERFNHHPRATQSSQWVPGCRTGTASSCPLYLQRSCYPVKSNSSPETSQSCQSKRLPVFCTACYSLSGLGRIREYPRASTTPCTAACGVFSFTCAHVRTPLRCLREETNAKTHRRPGACVCAQKKACVRNFNTARAGKIDEENHRYYRLFSYLLLQDRIRH